MKAAVIFVCCADLTAITTRERRIGELLEAGVFKDVDMDSSDSSTYTSAVMDTDAARAYLSMNVAIAVEHMVLKAVDLGLGSCWLGRFDRDMLKKVLALDENIYPVVLLPVGYSDQSPKERPRLSPEQLVLKII
jgi:nitroreductase